VVDVVVRPAEAEDRERVLEFTHDTFQWGDYIYRVFDRWLADKSGRLLVAELENDIVGLSFVKLTKKGEVWLQGGRVEKSQRRKGIGAAMIHECLRVAREEMNANIARVITDKTNLPPQRLLAKLGFSVVAEFTDLEKKVDRISKPLISENVEIAKKKMIPDIWRYTENSSIYERSGGLYTRWFVWYSLKEEDLRDFVVNDKAAVHKVDGRVHGVMLLDDTTLEAKAERSIQSCYFDADTDLGVKALSSFLINLAVSKGLEKARLWTYSDKRIIDSLKKAGFGREVDESTEILWMMRL
jgi:GNAT superfamily N-acetyltransferase